MNTGQNSGRLSDLVSRLSRQISRSDAAACPRRVLQNRDINNLFAGFELFDSVLRKSGVREVLFRKPA